MPLRSTYLIACLTYLILTVLATTFLFPQWAIAIFSEAAPEVVFSIDVDEPVVALTFDDGPHPDTTPALLDLLSEHGAKATFFLISDRIRGNEQIVSRLIDEGHEIGNHTAREESSIGMEPGEFAASLFEAHNVLAEFDSVRWFRPGSGFFNQRILVESSSLGYQTALGSVYPFDSEVHSSWFAQRFVLKYVKPGSVLILHDHDHHGMRAIATLGVVLPELLRRGYRVTTLSDLTNLQ